MSSYRYQFLRIGESLSSGGQTVNTQRQAVKILDFEQRCPVMPSAQSSQSDQPGIHEPWFVSGSCELHRGPPRSPPRAPINFLDLYNDAGSSRRALRTTFIDSDQQTSRTQTQTVTPLGLEPGHPDPLELSLVYLPVRDQTDPYNLRRDPPVSPPPGPVNVEVSDEDDDIIILSPRSFRQALSSRRTRRTPITDVESVEISGRNQRRRVDPQPSHVNSEGTNSSLDHQPGAPEDFLSCSYLSCRWQVVIECVVV
ncbi:hypothetical protein L1987_29257 [Smallanthus sonchifolius]|uniref:Uncharacterized protein n=1 Tax=Smallanthus sonchifolius TaxID=185202 RepID=A0ACB9HZI6_9ASTR|nr:hypothetical protein L1987_29257 [Smallanthus sonchifolius]